MEQDITIQIATNDQGDTALNVFDLIDFFQQMSDAAVFEETSGVIAIIISWLTNCKPTSFDKQMWLFTLELDDNSRIELEVIYLEDTGLFVTTASFVKTLQIMHDIVKDIFGEGYSEDAEYEVDCVVKSTLLWLDDTHDQHSEEFDYE